MTHHIENLLRALFLGLIGLGIGGCASGGVGEHDAWTTTHPAISVTDLDGKVQNPFVPTTNRKATVLLFITNDCPISNGYAA